jgi:hypothetical protein
MQQNSVICFSQGSPPWENPLKMAWSTDGVVFGASSIFQDSSGVPCVIRWKGDTLIAAFQWFRQPNPSPTWDRVAVKFSYDKGITWTQPTPIIVNGLPAGYQRPFDPTLAVFNGDSLRIYFSSSDGIPMGGLDSTVNTYSAKSADGINYFFEPVPRVDVANNRVIDPAVIFFNTGWHYLAPIGAPQDGAYHFVSPNGFTFTPVSNIPSDNMHNWTGNYMVESSSELRFYGSGASIWYNSTPNGELWSGYVNTNIQGGDPSVLKILNNNYLMVYVGQPYTSSIADEIIDVQNILIFPNPVRNIINVKTATKLVGSTYFIYDNTGKYVLSGRITSENILIDLGNILDGIYLFSVKDFGLKTFKLNKE